MTIKTQQVKTQNIPSLRFPGFLSEWKKENLGEACDFKQGVQVDLELQLKDASDGYNKFLRIENYTQKSQDFRFIPDSISKNSKIDAEDIVVVRYGATAGFISRGLSGVLANNLFSIRPKDENKILKDFLYKILKQEKVFKHLQSAMSGGAMPALSFSIMRPIKINLPSYLEQQKIASFLRSVDEWISNLRGQKESLEKYKKGMMQKIFSQEIHFRDERGNTYPYWEKKKLSSFLIEKNEQVPKSDQYPLMAFVAYKGVTPKGERYNREFLVNNSDNKKYKRTEYGDFIYSSNNLETGSIGLNRFGSASISPVYSIFKISESCNYQFIGSYLVRKSFLSKMIRYRQGVIYGQWRIHESDFLRIEEDIPSIEEQQKIAEFLESIDILIESKQRQISQSEQWKKGLMQGLFV